VRQRDSLPRPGPPFRAVLKSFRFLVLFCQRAESFMRLGLFCQKAERPRQRMLSAVGESCTMPVLPGSRLSRWPSDRPTFRMSDRRVSMSFKLPTTDQLRQVGEEIGLDLTASAGISALSRRGCVRARGRLAEDRDQGLVADVAQEVGRLALNSRRTCRSPVRPEATDLQPSSRREYSPPPRAGRYAAVHRAPRRKIRQHRLLP
jgi:hypothetical protein